MIFDVIPVYLFELSRLKVLARLRVLAMSYRRIK